MRLKPIAFILALTMILPLCLCSCNRTGSGEVTTAGEIARETTETSKDTEAVTDSTTATVEATETTEIPETTGLPATTAVTTTAVPETTKAPAATTAPVTTAATTAVHETTEAPETTATPITTTQVASETTATANTSTLITQYNDYVGTWYDTEVAPDILTLSIIDDYTFRLEVSIHRIADVYATVMIDNNEVIFLGNAVSTRGSSVNGTLEFKDNSIIFTITESDFMYLVPGYSTNFYIKVE